jgi:hypothetical protein
MSKVFQMSKEKIPDGRIRWVRTKKPVSGGRWFIDYTDHAGKQIRSATSASTKREALRILRARMGEQARAEAAGVRPQALSMTLEKFLDEVYLPHARVTLRPSTAKSYQAHAPLLKEHFGGKLLSTVKPKPPRPPCQSCASLSGYQIGFGQRATCDNQDALEESILAHNVFRTPIARNNSSLSTSILAVRRRRRGLGA